MSRFQRLLLATVGLFAAYWGVGHLLGAVVEPGSPIRGLGYAAAGTLLLGLSLVLYRRTHG